jgi:hypothetical protein
MPSRRLGELARVLAGVRETDGNGAARADDPNCALANLLTRRETE